MSSFKIVKWLIYVHMYDRHKVSVRPFCCHHLSVVFLKMRKRTSRTRMRNSDSQMP